MKKLRPDRLSNLPKVTQLETPSEHRPDTKSSLLFEHMQGLGVGPQGCPHTDDRDEADGQPLIRAPCPARKALGAAAEEAAGRCLLGQGQGPCRGRAGGRKETEVTAFKPQRLLPGPSSRGHHC